MLKMILTSSNEPVVCGPADVLCPGMVAPNGQPIAWVGRAFPQGGVLVAYGHFIARRTIDATGATLTPGWCRVCQGPHVLPHKAKGVPDPARLTHPAYAPRAPLAIVPPAAPKSSKGRKGRRAA